MNVPRSVFLVLGSGRDLPVMTWFDHYEVARDFARVHNAMVITVPALADYTEWATTPPGPEPEEFHQRWTPDGQLQQWTGPDEPGPSPFDAPSPPLVEPSGASDVGGWAFGGREVFSPTGWNYDRETDDAAPPHVITDAYEVGAQLAARRGQVQTFMHEHGVEVPPEAVLPLLLPSDDSTPVLHRVAEALREDGPANPLSEPVPLDDGPTVHLDRRPILPPTLRR